MAFACLWIGFACGVAGFAQAPDRASSETASPVSRQAAATSEEELKQQLLGKTFYLRGGYLENTLHFDDRGKLDGSSPQASYTLSLVEITSVHADKHRVQLQGVRYGLHFLGALASEDQSSAVDRVKLTSKKRPLKISIDREVVVTPKKHKPLKNGKERSTDTAAVPSDATAVPSGAAASADPSSAALPATDRHGATMTLSQDHANRALHNALDQIFAPGIDGRMIATLPDYWKLYYKALDEKTDYRPSDPAVLRQGQVEKKARLLTAFEPPSNEYAQNNGVAGMAMYHVVVGSDGKPGEIAIGRPIGFGLDENAVDAIRKATFEPAVKDGKPVPVGLDLTVQFRIYSTRTAVKANPTDKADGGAPLPGPYSVNPPQQP